MERGREVANMYIYIYIYIYVCVCVCVYIYIYAGVGKPLDYYVLEEDCHYSITWPSKYGCPASSGTA
jgi:hypothetical protein